MKSVMIDFETLGVGPNACVVQMGACYFDRETGIVGETFKRNVSATDAVKNGAVIDAGTVYWWLQQSEEARKFFLERELRSEIPAWVELNSFLVGAEEIWSHLSFDFVIMMNALRRLNLNPLFSLRVARDIRTLNALAGEYESPKREGVHHDALDDCIFQVAYCCVAFKALGKYV